MDKKTVIWHSTSHIAKRTFFYAGGQYKTDSKGEHYYSGQMFVEGYTPNEVTKKYPLLMLHGKGQTNTNWYGTPDGREGWLDFFLKKGYVVYLAEQPARGRSAWYEADGPVTYQSTDVVEYRFTGNKGKWEQAKLHTRWPKSAEKVGQNDYEQFMKAQVQFLNNDSLTVKLVVEAMEDVLRYTGPVILLAHSQAGRFTWPIADKYKESVMGIISIEPNGPPFSTNLALKEAANYGITDEPLTFDPPIASPADLCLQVVAADAPGHVSGLLQAEPARKLPRLMNKPIMIMVSEASYHAEYDWLTSRFLTQAGVKNDFYDLPAMGIHGNGHMVMMEDNSLEIAELISEWLQKNNL